MERQMTADGASGRDFAPVPGHGTAAEGTRQAACV
jgi:hypothetical protein